MGSSHGFRSTTCHHCALHARVRSASGCGCLRPATGSNSSDHSPKGTRSPWTRTSLAPTALTAWTRSVSGSLSLPSPGCFSPFPHGTVHYRSRQVSCLGRWSARLPTGFHVSRGTRDPHHGRCRCSYGTLTRSGAASQPLPRRCSAPLPGTHSRRSVSQPRQRNACMLGTLTVWAATRFARHYCGWTTTSSGY